MSAKCSQRPLVAEVILFTIFVLDKLIIFLVDTVVGEMHVLIVFVNLGGVSLTSKSCQTLLENIDSQWLIAGDEDVDSQIKFMTVNK